MPQPLKSRRQHSSLPPSPLTWPDDTEIVGLVFELEPRADASIYPQYAIGLHAWLLDQVRRFDPELSAYLHDGESEKPFTISGLDGSMLSQGRELLLQEGYTYRWYVTALSGRLMQWVEKWFKNLPEAINLRNALLQIRGCAIAHEPTTYAHLFDFPRGQTVTLSFCSPTSFRRKGHHLPLPWPVNVFHSYLRRWNDFSHIPFDQEAFLGWVDDSVLIRRHRLESVKVSAGKKGSVTGFTGAIEFGLAKEAQVMPQFEQLFFALGQLAPYCGTGHKTTFGLGQTRLGWLSVDTEPVPAISTLLAQRIAQLSEIFIAHRQRTGGKRTQEVAETWATILARRELGESLQAISQDLEMPYETVKTYAKLARAALKSD
ncbi:MAG: hypothetical protein NVS2B14_08190 [Chamaesiphon sp.]